jgi:hypothetical protein
MSGEIPVKSRILRGCGEIPVKKLYNSAIFRGSLGNGQQVVIFPVIFPVNGNLSSERGSLGTASTAI